MNYNKCEYQPYGHNDFGLYKFLKSFQAYAPILEKCYCPKDKIIIYQ